MNIGEILFLTFLFFPSVVEYVRETDEYEGDLEVHSER